jgi:hypothetical protein
MKDLVANDSPPGPAALSDRLLQRLGTGPLLIAGAAIVLTVVFGDLPGAAKYVAVLQNGCHAPAFAALSLITLAILGNRTPRQERTAASLTRAAARTPFVQAAVTVVAMLLLGAATEGLQGLLGRDAELDDVRSDVVGAIGATSLWLYAGLRQNPSIGSRVGRIGALLACAAMAGYWVSPLLQCANAYWNRDAQFPVLAQFRSQRDLYFVSSTVAAPQIVSIQQPANAGPPLTALRIGLDVGRWPGITLAEPVRDWRAFRVLALDLSNPGSVSVPLRLRVSDRMHKGDFYDRFNTQLLLSPQTRTTIYIPLERIALSPRTRRMDMSQISDLTLFRSGGAPGQAILVHRLWLQ